MKKITIVSALLVIAVNCNAQSISTQVANYVSAKNSSINKPSALDVSHFDLYNAFVDLSTIVVNTSNNIPTQTSQLTNNSGFSVIPMAIYTYSVTPLNHISAPVYSLCVTKDTGIYIKIVGTDSAGWFKAR